VYDSGDSTVTIRENQGTQNSHKNVFATDREQLRSKHHLFQTHMEQSYRTELE